MRRALLGVLAALLSVGALGASVLELRRRWLTVEVAGDSMVPALQAGDWLVVRLIEAGAPPLEAGAIALARDPSGRLLLKRVVGLPGETIELRDERVLVDGRPLAEPHARGETHPASELRTLTRLDRDAYYLLGDNRLASTDSRDHGPVRLGSSARLGAASPPAVEGVALFRYWPPGRAGRLPRAPRLLEGERAPSR
ncbi:MAG: signal peptidase I [Dehalococcoidia bacterium]|nr:signal peptidase I [Dehalococcoidia bacterium]